MTEQRWNGDEIDNWWSGERGRGWLNEWRNARIQCVWVCVSLRVDDLFDVSGVCVTYSTGLNSYRAAELGSATRTDYHASWNHDCVVWLGSNEIKAMARVPQPPRRGLLNPAHSFFSLSTSLVLVAYSANLVITKCIISFSRLFFFSISLFWFFFWLFF